MAGRVVFIGAGPGAADLITLRGARHLAQADVVLFDALTDPALREKMRALAEGVAGAATLQGSAESYERGRAEGRAEAEDELRLFASA